MGSSRKNKGHSVSTSSHKSSSGNSPSSSQHLLLQDEQDGDFVYFGWPDLIVFLLLAGAVISSSMLIGVLANASIAMHYTDSTAVAWNRITTALLDDEVVASSSRYGIHISPTDGSRSRVLLVEENTTKTEDPLLPRLDFWQFSRVQPTLCPDQRTIGFSDYKSFRRAIQEANAFSAERFVRWSEYFALSDFNGTFAEDAMYYNEEIVLTICPGTTFKLNRAIHINTEDLVVTCGNGSGGNSKDFCIIGGSTNTHMTFGPYARHVVIRGIEFKHATTSSLVFPHDGALVTFEDCRWIDNMAVHNKVGNVADVNSTSIVHFYRCSVGKRPDAPSGFISALSIRAH